MTNRATQDVELEGEVDAFISELAESMFGPFDKSAPIYEGPPRWHSFDLDGQAVDALRHVAELIPRAVTDPYLWKWVVIAMFDAMHGFFGLALRRGDGAQLLTPKHEQRTYQRWNEERRLGRPIIEREPDRIDWTRNLYAKVKDRGRMSYLGGKPLSPTTEEDAAFEYLTHLRDSFTHHGHGSHSVCVGELPVFVLECLSIIEWLFEKSETIRPRPEVRRQVRVTIQAVRDEAVAAAVSYKLDGYS